jgi:hypothetical protein
MHWLERLAADLLLSGAVVLILAGLALAWVAWLGGVDRDNAQSRR